MRIYNINYYNRVKLSNPPKDLMGQIINNILQDVIKMGNEHLGEKLTKQLVAKINKAQDLFIVRNLLTRKADYNSIIKVLKLQNGAFFK